MTGRVGRGVWARVSTRITGHLFPAPRKGGRGSGPATAGEPIRVGPAWGYGTVGSLLVRGVRTVSSCGRPGRDPGRSSGGFGAPSLQLPGVRGVGRSAFRASASPLVREVLAALGFAPVGEARASRTAGLSLGAEARVSGVVPAALRGRAFGAGAARLLPAVHAPVREPRFAMFRSRLRFMAGAAEQLALVQLGAHLGIVQRHVLVDVEAFERGVNVVEL